MFIEESYPKKASFRRGVAKRGVCGGVPEAIPNFDLKTAWK
jgi:hypothetical protein